MASTKGMEPGHGRAARHHREGRKAARQPQAGPGAAVVPGRAGARARGRSSSAPRPATRVLSAAVTTLLVALAAVLVGLAMPRGPVTDAQALTLLPLALALGLTAGYLTPTRWILLAAPALFTAVFELVRWQHSGPTVDLPHLDTTYGVLAFLLGRGVFAVLALVPIAVGANLGVGLARRRAPRRAGGRVRRAVGWGVTGAAVAGLAALALLLLRPASTPPIVGADGRAVPGSIATLEPVGLGGRRLWINVRAADPDNPVLLYLAGGPGQSDLAVLPRAARRSRAGLRRRSASTSAATGKSYPALEPTATFTLDGAIQDVVDLTDNLRARFGEERIYLLGESWEAPSACSRRSGARTCTTGSSAAGRW